MAKITRIKAKDEPRKASKSTKAKDEPRKAEIDKPIKVKKLVKVEAPKSAQKSTAIKKSATAEAPAKKVFILFRPFVAFFQYLKSAFKEIRQVRWPNRKVTWKMVLAVLVYTALFVVIISLLDLFFTWLFNIILGN